jgi:hypothetical protein
MQELNSLQSDAYDIINSLPKRKLIEAHSYLRYLKDKDEWIATQELSDTEILNEIRDGIDEINSGEFVRFNDVRRNV